MVPVEEVIAPILQGQVRAAAKLITRVENGEPGIRPLLRELYLRGGKARIVGITGPPGVGKSTITDQLVAHWRKAGKRICVVAVDPTSPFTGGAILGDRIRMGRHYTDPGVFIRSMATRGHLGGLSRATTDVVHIMDAMGWEVILIETVGVGQGEVDIIRLAHAVVLVQTPGGGDDVQAAKAGIMEIGDIFAVNKSRRDGADRAVHEIEEMLDFRYGSSDDDWRPPVLKIEALQGEGIEELAGRIEARWRFLSEHREAAKRLSHEQAQGTLMEIFKGLATERLLTQGQGGQSLEETLDAIAERRQDPYSIAERLLGES